MLDLRSIDDRFAAELRGVAAMLPPDGGDHLMRGLGEGFAAEVAARFKALCRDLASGAPPEDDALAAFSRDIARLNATYEKALGAIGNSASLNGRKTPSAM